jgi:hypothetical protein
VGSQQQGGGRKQRAEGKMQNAESGKQKARSGISYSTVPDDSIEPNGISAYCLLLSAYCSLLSFAFYSFPRPCG